MPMNHRKELHVQYGCGLCAPDDWLNFDVSPTILLQRIPGVSSILAKTGTRFPKSVRFGDIVKGLPIKEGSCASIYCSHTLEHLSLTDFRTALKNTYSYLKPGGTFRLVVPDLEQLIHLYLSSDSPNAAIHFMEASCLGVHERRRGIIGFLRSWIGNSKHLWMWDYKSMAKELKDVGFERIRRVQYGDAEISVFKSVEDPDRWHDCLGIECIRPLS